jgi:hypothetical protein
MHVVEHCCRREEVMRMHRILLAVVFLCSPSLLPAQAQKPKIDAAKLADIRRLMQLTRADAIGEQVAGPLMQSLKPDLNKVPPEKRARVQKMSETMFEKMLAYMKAQPISELAIPLYDKYFTAEDIKAMIQFYESPVGRKLSDVQPKMADELIPLAVAHSQQILQRVLSEMEADYPELREAPRPPAKNP